MEKLDIVIASVGAVVLVVAIAGAALSGGSVGRSSYQVLIGEESFATRSPTASPIPAHATMLYNITRSNVMNISFDAAFSALGAFAPTTSAHVKVTSPNGSTMERDGAPAPGASSFTIKIPFEGLATKPQSGPAPGGTPAEALARVEERNSTAAVGTWTVDVSYASGAPVPPPSESVSVGYSWTAWSPIVGPAPPTAK